MGGHFKIVFFLVVLGMSCLVACVVLEIQYAIKPNLRWNEILDCQREFPDVKGDAYFKNYKLQCPMSEDEKPHRNFLRREADHEYAFVLIVLVLIAGVGLIIPPLFKKKLRRGSYVITLSLGSAVLGLFVLPAFVMISFSAGEYYSNYAEILNHFSGINPQMNFKGKYSILGNTIQLWKELWQMITAKCVLNDRGGLGQAADLEDNVERKYSKLRNAPLLLDGAEYDYNKLQKIGFCPYQDIRFLSMIMAILGFVFFWLVACTNCFFKPEREIEPDSPQIMDLSEISTFNTDSEAEASSALPSRDDTLQKSKSEVSAISGFSWLNMDGTSQASRGSRGSFSRSMTSISIMTSTADTSEPVTASSMRSRKKKKPPPGKCVPTKSMDSLQPMSSTATTITNTKGKVKKVSNASSNPSSKKKKGKAKSKRKASIKFVSEIESDMDTEDTD